MLRDRLIALPELLTLALAAIVFIISSARITRLVVQDDFPPMHWVRDKYDAFWQKKTGLEEPPWALLLHCPWCFGPWITLLNGIWAYTSNLHWTWWVFNSWMALSYAVSWVTFHDEDGLR